MTISQWLNQPVTGCGSSNSYHVAHAAAEEVIASFVSDTDAHHHHPVPLVVVVWIQSFFIDYVCVNLAVISESFSASPSFLLLLLSNAVLCLQFDVASSSLMFRL